MSCTPTLRKSALPAALALILIMILALALAPCSPGPILIYPVLQEHGSLPFVLAAFEKLEKPSQ